MKNKTNTIILAIMLLITSFVKGQESNNGFAYNEGDNLFSVGISPFTYNIYRNSFYRTYTNYSSGVTFPPLTISYQKGIHNALSVGGVLGHYGYSYKWEYNHLGGVNKYKRADRTTILGALAEIHLINLMDDLDMPLDIDDNIDIYFGGILGVSIETYKKKNEEYIYNVNTDSYDFIKTETRNLTTKPIFRTYMGVRYYFTPKVAGYADFGYATFGYMNIGVSLKM